MASKMITMTSPDLDLDVCCEKLDSDVLVLLEMWNERQESNFNIQKKSRKTTKISKQLSQSSLPCWKHKFHLNANVKQYGTRIAC